MTTRMADLPTSLRHCLSDDDIEPLNARLSGGPA
jgi:hypothetical protein